MNHSIEVDFALADARYESFRSLFPQKKSPKGFAYNPSLSEADNLDNLALFALNHNTTAAVFHAFPSIFLDLVSRWVLSPARFEAAYTDSDGSNCNGSIILLAISRVFRVFPECHLLLEHFLHEHQFLQKSLVALPSHQLQDVLLAFYRLYACTSQMRKYVVPEILYDVISNGPDAVCKFLAIEILCKYLSVSDSSRSVMLSTHISDALLIGIYDHDTKIDFRFMDLVEAKRLSNFSALAQNVPAVTISKKMQFHTQHLSPMVTSICGVLVAVSKRSPIPEAQGSDIEAVPTTNAVDVLKKLAVNIQNNMPVMLYGQAGSGKTFLINQIAKYLSVQDSIVKIHLGEQTDAKLLLGTYTSGEKPGSFEWRSGVLTTAVKEGKWVLVEDIDKAPTEVLSILLTLLEKRQLSIPSRGEVINAHSGFKLISTVRTQSDASSSRIPDMIGLRLWNLIEVKTPNELELRQILATRYPILQSLIAKFITVYNKICHIYSMTSFITLNKGSHPRVISIRDLMKFCSRCDQMFQNKGVRSSDQLLETSIYENIFAEAVDCFGSAITEYKALSLIISAIGEILEIPSSRISVFVDSYVPTLYMDDEKIEIGRACLRKSYTDKALYSKNKTAKSGSTFARTKHSKRLMEQIGVGIEMVEPVLLVGETGTGKTTVVQEVAQMMNKKLTVINVSQQTESGDLLGGYKPVNTKTVAVPLQEVFENLFLATFSQTKNARYFSVLSKCFNKSQWKNVIKLWSEAANMATELLGKKEDSEEEADEGPKKKRKLRSQKKHTLIQKWNRFQEDVNNFSTQAANLENSFVFSFVEGSLVKAIRNGEWLLLDEINLASPDTLESIADLLSESSDQRSILLSERGDVEAIKAHPDFRIFGCMNPSTDVGKRDLPLSIRSRFSEIYVHSPDKDREDLTSIIEKYIERYAVGDDWVVEDIAELYYEAKTLAESNKIVDGANQKPHFSIRTLTRTLTYVREIVAIYGLRRALYEGFCMSFLTLLDKDSENKLKPNIAKYTVEKLSNAKQVISRCPPPPSSTDSEYVQFKHYWLKKGSGEISNPNYIITPFVEKNLLNLVRATASRKFPVLVQGPTSAGKTSMISYLASITGHKFVRINNHEHTDLQEYLGTYVSDSSGKLVFREGVLVEALRKGHWIVLDELNLAPTDVLEALNRLLDDNRELFIPETQEVIRPHPEFMLFATQNPPGLYGGRKILSRAFRNRFLELHFDDIPQDELEIILKERCQIAPSYGKKIVEVYRQLSVRRQSSRLFEQKNSFATLRDLFRWALREAVGYEELAANGYMLLAERVRSEEEKQVVKETIEKVMRVKLDMDAYYESLENKQLMELDSPIVWTKAMRRLAVLVEMSIKYKEPLLLVGETGCGKTTVCQIIGQLLGRELVTVNAHQNTETGDILGAQRPLRNRFELRAELLRNLYSFFELVKVDIPPEDSRVEDLVKDYERAKKNFDEDSKTSKLVETIDEQIKSSNVLFEWVDGPLVQAMKKGEFFLLDEISLADDSVLERLNSVLEPERSLLLAEKGTDDTFLTADVNFQFLATMNPGGDYGKKELSPALRNRFTEVWVPSMDDFNDVKQIVKSRLQPESVHLSTAMVQFSEWFGKKLGNGNANSGVISLRDILAWVEFINSCSQNVSREIAYVNGALMVFVDALGTNNTAYLAENEEKLSQYKQSCVEKLTSLIGAGHFIQKDSFSIEVTEDKLKADIFEIPRVAGAKWEGSFNLQAPTTSANAMRVMRAMQVNKPILLEGSPGVGKTSLVSAISKATGNHLIRINLSEQTDLIDLFGSDAPVEDGKTGEFVWRDAPFLRAMKNGEWVLLDEMNLASQSVLEGLNACLDHRGEAYIPELDRSFPKHPDFKVFAAQNPQYQGGGRKGLPKSFVNRFSVVYMDILKKEDLVIISKQLFPQISEESCLKMISFMSQLEEEVVINKKWGMSGGPWEFNLRDTLRWLGLYNSRSNLGTTSDVSIGDFLDMVICHRFRNQDDRQRVRELFESVFGDHDVKDAYFSMGENYVQAGGSVLKRSDLISYDNSSEKTHFLALQCNYKILESAIRAVNENLPLILTGPTNSGKTELIRYLATIAGVKLSEFSMNSDVDSMDILGGYEQLDLTRSVNAITKETFVLLNELVVINLKSSQTEKSVLARCLQLLEFMSKTDINMENFDSFTCRLQEFVAHTSNEKLNHLLEASVDLSKKLREVSTVKFNWFDGLLVKSVSNGDWLVLDNANLCNPSVLDRLNSLLETNGSLIINECSQKDGSPRVIVPHKNFRLFLTVDPKYGELSRAMRNRCVEIYLDDLSDRSTSFDRKCLGYEERSIGEEPTTAEAEELDNMMEKLNVHSIQSTRPMSAYVPSTKSYVRNFSLLNDIAEIPDTGADALAGVLSIYHTRDIKKWARSFKGSEFGSDEISRLEQVCSLINYLVSIGYVKNMMSLYGNTKSSSIVTNDFAANQALHPLINRFIINYLSGEGSRLDLKRSESSMLFLVASGIISFRESLEKLEARAMQVKLGDLSFIEKSAAVALGRELKKPPKIHIYSYVKAVQSFITKVFEGSIDKKQFMNQNYSLYESLAELQTVCECLFKASKEQNISKLRVYHGMVTSWLETHQVNGLVSEHAQEITSLKVGLELTSGFSMVKIWDRFRQVYPKSEVAWSNYANLLSLLNDFDIISTKLYPDTYGEVTTLRKSMLELHDEIVADTIKDSDMSTIFVNFTTAFKKLSDLAASFVVERINTFDREFTVLSEFLEISSYFKSSNLEKQLQVANYSTRPSSTLANANNSDLLSPYPRIFDCLWNKSTFSKEIFTNELLFSALQKTLNIDSCPGKYLDQTLNDVKVLGKNMIESSQVILDNQKNNFQIILVKWIIEMFKVHDLEFSDSVETMSSLDEKSIKNMLLTVQETCEGSVIVVFEQFFMPALHLISKSNTLPEEKRLNLLGKAWILFSSGCIQLYVPNSPLDPAIEDHVTFTVSQKHQEALQKLIASWRSVGRVISGDEKLRLESDLPKTKETEFVKPQIFRRTESIDELFDEWNAFMESAIDVEPLKRVLEAAEDFSVENHVQKVGIFHNNSANFIMRLKANYPNYADLNDILCGYIYGIRLGLDLMEIDSRNQNAAFKITSMWQLDIETLMSPTSIESTFDEVNNLNKEISGNTTLSEKVMLYFINLCFSQAVVPNSVVNRAFQSLYYRWSYRKIKADEAAAQEGSIYKHKDADNADEDFKELFPDYDEVMDLDSNEKPASASFDDLYYNIAKSYMSFYLEEKKMSVTDLADQGSVLCLEMQSQYPDVIYASSNPSQMAALLVSMKASHDKFSNASSNEISFYHEPNPAEYKRAMKTTLSIHNFIAKLLAQWPEHATLQNIARVVDEFLSFPSSIPLDKLLHKVELIFNYLNEWEKFASSQVSLKTLYEDLTELIVSWRRLELSSWKTLFHQEDLKFQKSIGKWWFHLFETIIIPNIQEEGFDEKPSVVQILGALNIFMTETTFGEFQTRLNLVRAFYIHLTTLEHSHENIINGLANFIQFYEQFIPHIEETITSTKKTLEKDISEVILLASWKDVNIDALKQSSKKSHNNLYKIVRKYRSLLSTSVAPIVEAGIPKENPVVSRRLMELKAKHLAELSKDEKLSVLLSCENVKTWSTRPARLKNINIVEKNLKVYIQRILQDQVPSIYDYTKEVVEEMERLKKETPSVINEDTKKNVASLKTQKHKLLSDTFKELRRIGVRTTVKPDIKKVLATVNLILVNSTPFSRDYVRGIDGHYFRCLEIMPRLRTAIAGGNEEVPQADLERGLAAAENLLFSLLTTRGPISSLSATVEELELLSDDLKAFSKNEKHDLVQASVVDSLELNMKEIGGLASNLSRVLDYVSDVVSSASYLQSGSVDTSVFSGLKGKCAELVTALPRPGSRYFTSSEKDLVAAFKEYLTATENAMITWSETHPSLKFVSDVVLSFIRKLVIKPFLNSCTSMSSINTVETVETELRKTSTSVILSVQKILELYDEEITDETDDWLTLSQQKLTKTVKLTHHTKILANLKAVRDSILTIEHNAQSSATISALVAFTMPLIMQYQNLCISLLEKSKKNYMELSKSTFILVKCLHTLASEGFCSPQGPNEQKDDKNMQDGTGWGDGEGADNNSKDAEEDDDLLEHAQKPNEEKDKNDEDDENDDAVDIEGDMAGDLEEASDQEKDDEDMDEQDEEDLDEEVDDIDDLDPNAVDEKMWDEEVKEDEKEKDSDKMPENPTNDDDDMQANEEENEKQKEDDQKEEGEEKDDDKGDDNDDGEEEDNVGEQEDEVKNEENEQLDEHVPENEALELPDDMNMDDEEEVDGDEEEEEEFEDKMDVDEEEEEEASKKEDKEDKEPEGAEENAEGSDEEGEDEDENNEEEEDDSLEPEVETADKDVDEDQQDASSDEETAQGVEEDEEKNDEDKEDTAENGEDAAEGEDGADNNDENQDVDMDNAAKTDAGEQGDGADNQVMEEKEDLGTTGAASTEKNQEESNEEAPSEDQARDEMKESLKKLGDSLKEFHRRRQEIKEASLEEKEETEEKADFKADEFEHVDGENSKHDTQALGAADNKDQVQSIDEDMAIDEEEEDEQVPEEANIKQEDDMEVDENLEEVPNQATEEVDDFEGKTKGGVVGERKTEEEKEGEEMIANHEFEDETMAEQELETYREEDFVINHEDVPAMDVNEARDLWRSSEIATQELASGLSEQLRLILEPTLATKLRGDYKTGKRLNMKRIISYIASDFRKDKIWLRRTKPSKRQYQIMIAVDDSKSMSESKATELAFHSIALVSKALTQLESGGLSVVRFGEDVKLVHPFDRPFTQETGANVFKWFDFKQERTDIKQLCQKSLKIFENARSSSSSDLWQLQIILSDGVCEDHETVQRLVRKAREEKVMLVFVVIDGINSNESILDMSQVSYVADPVTGAMSLKVNNYLDTFPFEFYVVVRDINELPEMLSLILRQYFTEVANI